mmetsp:Transcript_25962/g.46828  ORF Transcript_25962/g.46828 Transcript_25962/m.46828 type:complete len:100 (+) Transcript_25962:375-674(+)
MSWFNSLLLLSDDEDSWRQWRRLFRLDFLLPCRSSEREGGLFRLCELRLVPFLECRRLCCLLALFEWVDEPSGLGEEHEEEEEQYDDMLSLSTDEQSLS